MDLGLAHLASAPHTPGSVEAVLSGDEVFEALLAEPDLGPPAGFVAMAEGKVWSLEDPSLASPLGEEAGWPLLVAVGETDAGRCHLNLGALALVAIAGPEAGSLVAQIADQLAQRARGGKIDLVVVGAEPGVAGPSLRRVETCAEGLAGLSGSGEDVPPRVLVCFIPLSGEEQGRLVDSLEQPHGLDAAVVLGDVGGRGWPVRAEVGQVVLERVALSLSPLAREREVLSPVPTEQQPPATPVPCRPGCNDAGAEAMPLVRVLGPVAVEGLVDPMGGKALELVVYLALHPRGVGDDGLQTALWPDRMPARGTFNNLVSLARRQLGSDADGSALLPHAVDRRYRLAPLVGCDLARFEALADQVDLVPGGDFLDLLVGALELVTGRPFDEADGYEWAHREGLVAAAERRVVAVAHRLAEEGLRAGDLERAEWAARQGLRAAPGDEALFRDRMLVAHAAGSTSAVESIMDELASHLDGEDPLSALHPDTVELYHRLGQRPLARR